MSIPATGTGLSLPTVGRQSLLALTKSMAGAGSCVWVASLLERMLSPAEQSRGMAKLGLKIGALLWDLFLVQVPTKEKDYPLKFLARPLESSSQG